MFLRNNVATDVLHLPDFYCSTVRCSNFVEKTCFYLTGVNGWALPFTSFR